MKYVLDTNTVAALMKSDAEVLSHLKKTNRRDVGLPQPVIAEIAYGIARLPKSKRRKLLEDRFETISETFGSDRMDACRQQRVRRDQGHIGEKGSSRRRL